jgi:hypothetical protein
MAITYVTSGAIKAVDINQALNALSKKSGQTDTGQYHLGGNAYVTGGEISINMWYTSRSTGAVSVSIDTSIQAPSGFTVSTGYLTYGSFQIKGIATAAGSNMNAQGNYTATF